MDRTKTEKREMKVRCRVRFKIILDYLLGADKDYKDILLGSAAKADIEAAIKYLKNAVKEMKVKNWVD